MSSPGPGASSIAGESDRGKAAIGGNRRFAKIRENSSYSSGPTKLQPTRDLTFFPLFDTNSTTSSAIGSMLLT